LKADPKLAQASFRLGWTYVKEGKKKDEGIKLMVQSLSMENGETCNSLFILGDLLMREGTIEQID
jgi:hypothetical protein